MGQNQLKMMASDPEIVKEINIIHEEFMTTEMDGLTDHKKRIDKRRSEIAKNGEETLKALSLGQGKKGTAEEIKAYLLEDEDEFY
ncbi:hypothetical protein [Crocosphaera sp.]|uniref:hypothetical protein n=1 Tax=Crocosphaera sp. TaxID=2729996 RepID=UPI003F246229|nr:hypothetical protein [Crocosphaera sp.]